MRIAKTLEDLPTGTPVVINGLKTYRGLVIEVGWTSLSLDCWVKILFTDGSGVIYYEEDLEEEQIRIVEIT